MEEMNILEQKLKMLPMKKSTKQDSGNLGLTPSSNSPGSIF